MTKKATVAQITKSRWFIACAAFILGVLVILGIRFATYQPPAQTHYHANFAVYINGQRQMFKGSGYYEETEMCVQTGTVTTAMRAHMHDGVNDVVHVEDHTVTWGQFFNNLGWYLGDDFIKANGNLYLNNEQQKLSIMLNGQDLTGITSVANAVIGDRDRLLVSYGSDSQTQLQEEYSNIPATAARYDTTKDPVSCSGHNGSSMRERMTHIF